MHAPVIYSNIFHHLHALSSYSLLYKPLVIDNEAAMVRYPVLAGLALACSVGYKGHLTVLDILNFLCLMQHLFYAEKRAEVMKTIQSASQDNVGLDVS